MSFGAQLVGAQNFMSLWVPDPKYKPLWISIFFIVPFLFNLLNVRRYGEVEYWLVLVKVVGVFGIIILGLVLAMGATAKSRQLGLGPNGTMFSCSPNHGPDVLCLDTPGFTCFYTH